MRLNTVNGAGCFPSVQCSTRTSEHYSNTYRPRQLKAVAPPQKTKVLQKLLTIHLELPGYPFIYYYTRARNHASSMAKCLPNVHKALGLIPSTVKWEAGKE